MKKSLICLVFLFVTIFVSSFSYSMEEVDERVLIQIPRPFLDQKTADTIATAVSEEKTVKLIIKSETKNNKSNKKNKKENNKKSNISDHEINKNGIYIITKEKALMINSKLKNKMRVKIYAHEIMFPLGMYIPSMRQVIIFPRRSLEMSGGNSNGTTCAVFRHKRTRNATHQN